jgi:cellulose synthase/poly-beta-1,6-N-acetylglucosamine synthase-like glycosyltransferase
MRALDYPRDMVQVLLVLEADDTGTVAAVADAALPGNFEWVRVPQGQPRTKPRACNYALQFVRGDYVVIFDAEDRPEPDQLRRAAAAFAAAPPDVACFQARLNFYNAGQNWLTRLFALDYALWFDYLLPGLERIGIPMPLGGTSNHFRATALNAIHGWDPYNVTEDADIGIRLWRMGHRVRTLDSTTFEEAPCAFRDWLGQRSRWLKGYMQTWLVHMRNPARLLRNAGPGGFIGFQLFVGGTFAAALFNPILWLLFLASPLLATVSSGFPLPHLTAELSLGGLLVGNLLVSYLMMLGPVRRGWLELTIYGLAAPLYWALISIAGYRALYGLIVRPWHWHKTPHGLASAGPGGAA